MIAEADSQGLRQTDSGDGHYSSRRAAGRTETENLRCDPEFLVAGQSATRSCDLHRASSRSAGHGRRHESVSHYFESCRGSVEGYARGSGEALAEDFHGCSYFAGGVYQADEGFQAGVETVKHATGSVGAAKAIYSRASAIRISVQSPIGVLKKCDLWGGPGCIVEVVNQGETAIWRDLKGGSASDTAAVRAISLIRSHAIQISISALHNTGVDVTSVGASIHDVQNCKGARRRYLEDTAKRATGRRVVFCRAVEIPIIALNQGAYRTATGSAVKQMKNGELAGGRNPKDLATPARSEKGSPVKITVSSLYEGGLWLGSVRAVEHM